MESATTSKQDQHHQHPHDNKHRNRLTKAPPSAFPSHAVARALSREGNPIGLSRNGSASSSSQASPVNPTHSRENSDSTPFAPSNSAIPRSHAVDSAYNPAFYSAHSSRASVTDKTTAELLGPSFDAQGLVQDLHKVQSHQERRLSPTQGTQYTPLQEPYNTVQNPYSPDPRLTSPKLRQSQSVAALGRKMERVTPPRMGNDSGTKSPRQRYSDEARPEGKKKGLFSSLVNGLSNSPRRPTISTPSNPMHVTHVSIDNETGQFTVGFSFYWISQRWFSDE